MNTVEMIGDIVWFGKLALAALILSFLLGCGHRSVTAPSVTAAAAVVTDWTQPAPDVLDYFVPADGITTTATPTAAGGSTVGTFLTDGGQRVTMCGGGSCAIHGDYRVDGDYLWMVQDAYLYSGGMGSQLGVRWAARDWRSQAGKYLWSWCGKNGDCVPCSSYDDQECRRENGYVLLQDCATGRTVNPLQMRTSVVDRGVVDWGGTVGRRHSIDIVYESDAAGHMRTEIMHLARGAGLVWWEDLSGTTPGWGPRSRDYYVRDARALGYRVEDSHKTCGW